MRTSDLLIKSKDAIKAHPKLKAAIVDNYDACLCEISDGSSEDHEVALALETLNEIIEEGEL